MESVKKRVEKLGEKLKQAIELRTHYQRALKKSNIPPHKAIIVTGRKREENSWQQTSPAARLDHMEIMGQWRIYASP